MTEVLFSTQANLTFPNTDKIESHAFQKFVESELCRLWMGSHPSSSFRLMTPNPVSLERRHFNVIHNSEYVITEKTDGTRYICLFTRHPTSGEPVTVCINRALDIFPLRVYAPKRIYDGTIFDGELVWQHTGPPRQVFFVFDCYAYCGQSITEQHFFHRFEIIRTCFPRIDEAVQPGVPGDHWETEAVRMAQNGQIVNATHVNGMIMAAKTLYSPENMEAIQRAMYDLQHTCDGLIFTPTQVAAVQGRHQTQYKWKWHHTVDLRLLPRGELQFCIDQSREASATVPQAFAVTTDGSMVDSNAHVSSVSKYRIELELTAFLQRVQHRVPKPYGRIVECLITNLDDEKEVAYARVIRVRLDKQLPNQKYTIERTLWNVRENIQWEDLIHTFDKRMQTTSNTFAYTT